MMRFRLGPLLLMQQPVRHVVSSLSVFQVATTCTADVVSTSVGLVVLYTPEEQTHVVVAVCMAIATLLQLQISCGGWKRRSSYWVSALRCQIAAL
jgi:hypothetical protein